MSKGERGRDLTQDARKRRKSGAILHPNKKKKLSGEGGGQGAILKRVTPKRLAKTQRLKTVFKKRCCRRDSGKVFHSKKGRPTTGGEISREKD